MKYISQVKNKKIYMLDHFWLKRRFASLARWVDLPGKSDQKKGEGFVALLQTMAGVGYLKKICEDALRLACAVEEKYSSDRALIS